MSISGCNTDSGISEVLSVAEDRMDAAPDSVLRLIDTLDIDDIANEGVKARYALLYTQALDKNYIDVKDDSLVTVALTYYRNRGDDYHTMLAAYYRARILYNNADYTHAIYSILESEQLARQLNDTYYLARTNEVLADIYAATYNLPQEIKYRKKAVDYYKISGRSKNNLYALMDLSMAYANNKHYDMSKHLLDSLRFVVNEDDSIIIPYYIKCYMNLYLYNDKFAEAKSLYKILLKYGNYYRFSDYDYAKLSEIYAIDGKIDSAKIMIDLAIENMTEDDNLYVEYAKYKLFSINGDFNEALEKHERLYDKQDSMVRNTLSQSTVSAHRDFYITKTDKNVMLIKQICTWGIFIVSLLMTTVIFIFIIHREKIKRVRMEMDFRMSEIVAQRQEISHLNKQLETHKSNCSMLTVKVNELFGNHFKTLNLLCDEYYGKQDSDKTRLTIYKEIEKEIMKMCEPKEILRLENIVNEYKCNIVEKLRSQFPDMKETDVVFLTMIFAGLSPRAICIFTNNKIGNYYNKRQRLRAKIQESDSEYKELFLSNIA